MMAIALAAPLHAHAAAPSTLYVPNSLDGTVTPIDTSANTAGSAISMGAAGPVAIAIAPGASTAYVAENGTLCFGTPGNGQTDRIDTSSNTVGTPIATARCDNSVAASPDGSTVYVTDFGTQTLIPIPTTTGVAGTPIAIGLNINGVFVSPDGTTAYVLCQGPNEAVPVDLATGIKGSPIALPNLAFDMTFSPDGATGYIATESGVVPIDTTTNTAQTAIAGTGNAISVAMAPDGSTLYVGTDPGNSVIPVSLPSKTAGTPIAVSGPVASIAVLPDGTTVYAVCFLSNQVEVIDPLSNTVTKSINVGSQPQYAALTTPARGVTTTTIHTGSVSSNVASTYTATVSATSGGIPQGRVQFFVDGSAQGVPEFLDGSGHVSITTSLTAGPHTVTADYTGTLVDAPSSGNLPLTVAGVPVPDTGARAGTSNGPAMAAGLLLIPAGLACLMLSMLVPDIRPGGAGRRGLHL